MARATSRPAAAAIIAIAAGGIILPRHASVHTQAGPPAVRTQHNDRARTGVNDAEFELTPDLVHSAKFGLQYRLDVKGQVYAQPLYLPNVVVAATSHRVVFVATMHNNVYAFDADTHGKLWAYNFGCPVPYNLVRLNWLSFDTYNIHDAVGIHGTPAIDDSGEFLYFVSRIDRNALGQSSNPDTAACKSNVTADLRFMLHKVRVESGLDAAPPREIHAQLSPKAQLDPFLHLQRPGLLLANGSVYVAFGSNWDTRPWHGWIFRFTLNNLSPEATFCVTPTGAGGGIWQAGSGLAADSEGDIVFITGNGTTKPDAKLPNLGTAFVQLAPDLSLRRYYVPSNHWWLNLVDLDLGASGAVVLPDGGIIGGGKQGRLYMLGQPANVNDRHLVLRAQQKVTPRCDFPCIPPAADHHIHGTPVVWNHTPDRARIFVWGERDHLKALTYVHTPTSAQIIEQAVSPLAAPKKGMPGGILSLSVNGSDDRTAILWASLPFDEDAFTADVRGVLRAVDPHSLKELWNDAAATPYLFAKYCPPTVVDGRVFLATLSESVNVYGRISP